MSVSKNRELSSWKAVLAKLRRIETTWQGLPLSRLDHLTYTEGILMWAMVLNDLSNRFVGFGDFRQHAQFAIRMAHWDVADLAACVSDAITALRASSSPYSSLCDFESFKRSLQQDHPKVGEMLAPIRGGLDTYFSERTGASFSPVYQSLSFLNHLSLRDLEMGPELEDEYIQNEFRLSQLRLHAPLVQGMRRIMAEWFRGFEWDEASFYPKHGPGAVADVPTPASIASKYLALSPDLKLSIATRISLGVEAESFLPDLDTRVPTTRVSRIIFVPKSMKTKRVISAEPATLMYFQQGVRAALYSYMRRHSYLGARIDLNDQSKQQQVALHASRSRTHATVDLSAASDSIHVDLVKEVFRDTPLYPFLVALRSSSTELPSGKVVSLTKYAPMGSALTFPIETLIFASIAEYTVRYVHATTGVFDSSYRVYGDDIIIPESSYYDLVQGLRLVGFKTNEAKSYGGSHRFRESCGMDAYDGEDVTPMKISRRYSARGVTPRSPGALQGIIDMANAAYTFDFELLRRYLVDKLINEQKVVPYFSEQPSVGLYTPMPTNHRLRRKWDPNWQRMVYYGATTISVQAMYDKPHYRAHQHRFTTDDRLADSHLDAIRLFERLRLTSSDADGTSYGDSETPGDWGLSGSLLPDYEPHEVTRIGSSATYVGRTWQCEWGTGLSS